MRKDNIIISHSAFTCLKPSIKDIRVKVLIFISKTSKNELQCTPRSDIVNGPDMQAILIKNNSILNKILLFNIYNKKSQKVEQSEYTIERELAKIKLDSDQKVIIAEDFNAHYN